MGVGHMPNTSDIVTIEEFFEQAKGYLNDKQLEFVRSAYILAADAHKEQRRKSGEPYIIHPIGVASILASLQMDEYTLAAAFLHDVVEDTEYTFDDIRNIFGMVVANLVDGVTKLGKIAYISKEDRQIENYRKMFLAMARDIRVVLIKLADRLHNMRTMKRGGMNIVASGYVRSWMLEYTPGDLEGMARAYSTCIAANISVPEYAKRSAQMIKDYRCDNMVCHNNRSCKISAYNLDCGKHLILGETQIPCVSFDGDQSDYRAYSEAQFETRIQGLSEILDGKGEDNA
jgi:hypothetical protein